MKQPDKPILRRIQESVPDCTYRVDVSIEGLEKHLELYNVNLDPKYQRDYVWNTLQQQMFVGALLENPRSIPVFWFNWVSKEYNRSHSEVVDGKQRINAVRRWMRNEYPARCPCGIQVMYGDLDEIRFNCLMRVTMGWHFVELNELDVMKFYLRLNAGGVVHSDEDLDKVRKLIKEKES